jgi:glucose-6-phosphate-specific signal transduction histidine kinase
MELEYTDSQLRVVVRDDGLGIDPQVLQSGREGHWGLRGMRERAEKIGAQLRVSKPRYYRNRGRRGGTGSYRIPRRFYEAAHLLVCEIAAAKTPQNGHNGTGSSGS